MGSVVFPVMSLEGDVTEIYGRKITAGLRAGTPLHTYLPGPHRGVWNEEALIASKEIILCESILDALKFWCAGHRNVTASYGVNGFTEDHKAAFKKHGVKNVWIAYDRDDAGDAAAERLKEELDTMGIGSHRVLLPRGLDANEYARTGGSLAVLLNGSERLTKGEQAPAPVIPLAADPLVMVNGGEVTLEREDRRYRVRGLGKNTTHEILRGNVLVSRKDDFHIDTFDLNTDRQRIVFIKRAAEELHVKEDVIRSLGGAELGPGKHLHAQINHAAVQAEKLAGKLLARMVDQRKKQILINLPTAVFIGIGERGVTGLAEQHRYKLIPTREAPSVPHPTMPGHGCIEKPPWRHAQKLAENAGSLSHGRSPSGVEMCSCRNFSNRPVGRPQAHFIRLIWTRALRPPPPKKLRACQRQTPSLPLNLLSGRFRLLSPQRKPSRHPVVPPRHLDHIRPRHHRPVLFHQPPLLSAFRPNRHHLPHWRPAKILIQWKQAVRLQLPEYPPQFLLHNVHTVEKRPLVQPDLLNARLPVRPLQKVPFKHFILLLVQRPLAHQLKIRDVLLVPPPPRPVSSRPLHRIQRQGARHPRFPAAVPVARKTRPKDRAEHTPARLLFSSHRRPPQSQSAAKHARCARQSYRFTPCPFHGFFPFFLCFLFFFQLRQARFPSGTACVNNPI